MCIERSKVTEGSMESPAGTKLSATDWLGGYFLSSKKGKSTMTGSEQISSCPYTVLRCPWSALAHKSPSLPLSCLGWWPSATEDTLPNKSSLFQHLQGPKALPLTKIGPSFSHRESPQGPQNPPLSQLPWRGVSFLFHPLWQKASEGQL